MAEKKKIEDAEWVKFYGNEGEESKKVRALLEEKMISFGERKHTGDFPVNVTIRGKESRNLGAATSFPPPVIEVYLGPGKYLVFQGFDAILEGIESEW